MEYQFLHILEEDALIFENNLEHVRFHNPRYGIVDVGDHITLKTPEDGDIIGEYKGISDECNYVFFIKKNTQLNVERYVYCVVKSNNYYIE